MKPSVKTAGFTCVCSVWRAKHERALQFIVKMNSGVVEGGKLVLVYMCKSGKQHSVTVSNTCWLNFVCEKDHFALTVHLFNFLTP